MTLKVTRVDVPLIVAVTVFAPAAVAPVPIVSVFEVSPLEFVVVEAPLPSVPEEATQFMVAPLTLLLFASFTFTESALPRAAPKLAL